MCLDKAAHLGQPVLMQSDEPTTRTVAGPILGAAVSVAVVSVLYSAMLGFGVNERCDTLAPSDSSCDRLNWLALLHAGAQASLVVGVGIVGVFVWRSAGSRKRIWLLVAIGFVYICLAGIAAVVYTDAAWDWANSFD